MILPFFSNKKKKEIYDGDIIALVQQQISGSVDEEWTLVDYVVTSGKSRDPYVELTLRCGDDMVWFW